MNRDTVAKHVALAAWCQQQKQPASFNRLPNLPFTLDLRFVPEMFQDST